MSTDTLNFNKYISNNREALSKEITDRFFEQYPHIKEKYSENDIYKTIQDFSYHLSYLAESVTLNNKKMFLDYMSWVKNLFMNLNFNIQNLSLSLECLRDVLLEKIDDEEIKKLVGTYINESIELLSKDKEKADKNYIKNNHG
ncbi:MAG: hypothetical protein ACOCV8_02045 [Spirochaetota bacterium]